MARKIAQLTSGFIGLIVAFNVCSFDVYALPARFAVAPDNNQELLFDTFSSAKKSLIINIYSFTSNKVADALVARIRAGVSVQLLIESTPAGGMNAQGRQILQRIRDEMTKSGNSAHRLFLMSKPPKPAKRRFRLDHAKYVLADNNTVLISSENFTDNSRPNPGVIGNRGWEVALTDAGLRGQLYRVFQNDTDLSFGDIFEVGPHDAILPGNNKSVDCDSREDVSEPRHVPALPIGNGDVQDATLITAPDALEPVLEFIRSAQSHVEFEFLNLPTTWLMDNNSRILNPLIQELVKASARGVVVRVLLNDPRAFFSPDPTLFSRPAADTNGNEASVNTINRMAHEQNIPLSARIVNIKNVGITYVHNKGILVDGHRALISSINGTQNSSKNNREVAVILDGHEAYRYYADVFNFDWKQSPKLRSNSELKVNVGYWFRLDKLVPVNLGI